MRSPTCFIAVICALASCPFDFSAPISLLTVLRSATDLLNQHRDQPIEREGELFDDVRAEIARMERLAQDLLTLARYDAGGLELMTAPLDLADIASEVVRRITPLAQSKGVQLTLRAEPQASTVDADPDVP